MALVKSPLLGRYLYPLIPGSSYQRRATYTDA
jgi:hypothetical protein